jgi:3-methyladenine DNA glycosylase/8-oxoguanine DNA glycosylase
MALNNSPLNYTSIDLELVVCQDTFEGLVRIIVTVQGGYEN